MFGKKSKAVVAGLSLVMALAPAVPAFAVNEITTSPNVTKTMKANPESHFNTTFTYTATAVQLTGEGAVNKDDNPAITAVTKNATGDAEGDDALTTEAFGFKTAQYPAPGVYAYQVAETKGNEHLRKDSRDLMTYDNTTYTVFVYVVNGKSGLEVSAVTAVKDATPGTATTTLPTKADDSKKESSLAFENSYWEYGNEGGDKTADLTVDKDVQGNMGDTEKDWKFTVTFDESGLKVNPENQIKYQIVTTGSTADETKWENIPASNEYTLKDNQQILFKDVVAGTKYSVVEAESGQDGYETKGEVAVKDAKTMGEKGASETVVNKKENTVVTGVIMNNAPFIVMIGVAAAGVAAYGAAKRKLEK